MTTINLRDFYPWCKENASVEITDEMLEAMKAADRQEAAYKRRTYRYIAHYTLDMVGDGIENECIVKPETPEEIYDAGAFCRHWSTHEDSTTAVNRLLL